jgi:hypothetical protein
MIDRIKQMINLLCNSTGDCRVQRIGDSDVSVNMGSYGKVYVKAGPIEASAPCNGFTFRYNSDCYAWRTLAENATGTISFGEDYSIMIDNGFMVVAYENGKYVISDVRDNQWFDVYAQITPCPRFIDVFSMTLGDLVYFKGKIDIRMKMLDAEMAVKPDVAWAKVNGVRISVFRSVWLATEKSVRDLVELARKISHSL